MKSGIVEFRPYRPDDSESIERIIADTWGSQENEPTNADIVYSKVYIAYCLMISTYAETALIDGSPVGVVMARDLSVRKHFVLKLVLFLLRNFWRVLRPSGIMALIALYRIEIANPRELSTPASLRSLSHRLRPAGTASGKGSMLTQSGISMAREQGGFSSTPIRNAATVSMTAQDL